MLRNIDLEYRIESGIRRKGIYFFPWNQFHKKNFVKMISRKNFFSIHTLGNPALVISSKNLSVPALLKQLMGSHLSSWALNFTASTCLSRCSQIWNKKVRKKICNLAEILCYIVTILTFWRKKSQFHEWNKWENVIFPNCMEK